MLELKTLILKPRGYWKNKLLSNKEAEKSILALNSALVYSPFTFICVSRMKEEVRKIVGLETSLTVILQRSRQ